MLFSDECWYWKADEVRRGICTSFTAEGSLSFDFHTRPVSLNLLLANRAPRCRDRDNPKRILSETKLGVNRWEKISRIIRHSKAEIIIAETTTSHLPKAQRRRREIIEPTLTASVSEAVKGG